MTLPLSIPVISRAFLIIFIFAFGGYELPLLLGSTLPKALSVQTYLAYMSPNLLERPLAMAMNGVMLLLDEPFSALDENLREEMRALVLALRREFDMTVILVTHDRAEALSMSDRVALLFDGQIAQIGTPREVYHRPGSRRVADYFGNCVYVPGTIRQGTFCGGGLTCQVDLTDGNYTLMLRPGELRLGKGSIQLTVEQVTYRGGDTLVTLQSSEGIRWKIPQSWDCPWHPGDVLQADVELSDPVLFSE